MNEPAAPGQNGQKKADATRKKKIPQGFYVLSVKQGTGCYRHLKLSKRSTLEDLADAILWAFDFMNDHAHAFFMNNSAWTDTDCYYCEDVDEDEEYRHTCDYDLTVLTVGQKFKFVFDFGEGWEFDCRVLRETPDGSEDEAEIIRAKGEPPAQYSMVEDDDDEPDQDEPMDDDE